MAKSNSYSLIPFHYGFIFVLLTNGFIFLRSSYGKISEGKFVDSLAPTLEKFGSKNPYPWYKDFLSGSIIPNSNFFGNLIMWGELLSALAIISAGIFMLMRKQSRLTYWLMVVGLLGGLILNVNFYFAAGWTSPSTESLNLLMGLIELIGLLETIKLLTRFE